MHPNTRLKKTVFQTMQTGGQKKLWDKENYINEGVNSLRTKHLGNK